MAVITATGSGNWSSTTAGAPWNGGTKPSAGDSVVINTGVVLTVDESTPDAITSISGAGTLALGTASGARTIYCSGNISCLVTGGSSGTPMPLGSDTTFQLGAAGKFTTSTAGGIAIYGGLIDTVDTGMSNDWTAEIKTTTGATDSTIDVIGDVRNWNTLATRARQTVWITKKIQTDTSTIANARRLIHATTDITYNSGTNTSTITLASALTEVKEAGGHVTLETRNVRCTYTGTQNLFDTLTNMVTQAVEFINTNATSQGRIISGGTGHNATSATFTGNSYGIAFGTDHNATSATFTRNTNGIHSGTGHNATSATFTGNSNGIYYGTGHNATSATFTGNSNGISGGTGHNATSATFTGNTNGIYSGTGHKLYNCTFGSPSINTTADIQDTNEIVMSNCTLASTVQNKWTKTTGYLSYLTSRWKTDSLNHNNTANARKCFTLGGFVSTLAADSVSIPAGSANSVDHQMFCNDVLYLCFMEDRYTLLAGVAYTFHCEVRRTVASMTLNPVFELANVFSDTLDMGGTALDSATMTAGADTWEVLELTYTPTNNEDVWLRLKAQHGSGNVYFKMWMEAPVFPAAADVIEGAAGDVTGTYHEAAVGEVQSGVMFGPSSTLEGTYAGGGGVIVIDD